MLPWVFITVSDTYFIFLGDAYARAREMHNGLLSFTSEHSLFVYDMHEEIFKKLIEDEAEKMVPTEEIHLGSITIPTFAVDEKHPSYSLHSILNGRHLKEGENQEEFLNDVKEANRLSARLTKESEIAVLGQVGDAIYDQFDCLKEVPRKKAFFVYEVFNRGTFDFAVFCYCKAEVPSFA